MNDSFAGSHALRFAFFSHAFSKRLPRAILAVALGGLAIFSFGSTAQAQLSPVGIWDFVVQGQAQGSAVFEFLDDGSLYGFSIVAPPLKPSSSSSSSSLRGGPVGVDPRTGVPRDGSSTNSTTVTNTFGGAIVDGFWTFAGRGVLIGFFQEVSSSASDYGTLVFHTNGVSFRATLTANALVLRTSSTEGKGIYRGVHSGAAPDITGFYFAEGKKQGLPFSEFFVLTPMSFDNVYQLSGNGGGYDLGGFAILTANGQLTVQPQRSSGVFLSVTGKYNAARKTALLKGGSSDGGNASYRITGQ